MNMPANHLEIPKTWGWYYPTEHLAQILRAQLAAQLPEGDSHSVELVSYHQDRDEALLRHREQPDRFTVVSLKRQTALEQSPAVFGGSFSAFVAREQKRHEIERRIIEQPNRAPGICPVCFAVVTEQEPCGGIWTGAVGSKATSGPLHSATCERCHSMLIAMPTPEDAEAGVFLWSFSEWGNDAA